MRSGLFTLHDAHDFRKKALNWAVKQGNCCCFDSNQYHDPYSAFSFLLAAGVKEELRADENAFNQLQYFLDREKRWSFGFLTYDLKNELEELSSANPDPLGFPLLYFFEPEHLIRLNGPVAEISSPDPDAIYHEILATAASPATGNNPVTIKNRVSRDEYLAIVEKIRGHILRGDIYELNYCQEFYSENAHIDPVAVFGQLNEISPSPFAVFFKEGDRYLLSATPERFLRKKDLKLISQPIKGTVARSDDPAIDRKLAQKLKTDEKEQAENVMIVDLVRNDLTRCAMPGTVRVEELFGIYSFSQVHQMISTIVCAADPDRPLTELIKPLFPMGSMTGAPKHSAMQLIETYERSKRGLFSGAAGYFSPEGDFDFNVIIRSILYHAGSGYLSFQAGSAITYGSIPEREYDECLVKTAGIRSVLE
jgi:para-aminobenzoate synthetase component 1